MTVKVSESEKLVLEVLWNESPLGGLEVVDRLTEQGWNRKTVKTFLNRLVKKGVVSYQKDGRRYVYFPVVQRTEYLMQASRGFLDKVFRGNMKELLTTFVENKQLSTEELEYLTAMLNKKSTKDRGKK